MVFSYWQQRGGIGRAVDDRSGGVKHFDAQASGVGLVAFHREIDHFPVYLIVAKLILKITLINPNHPSTI
jgi:hypothetical protein